MTTRADSQSETALGTIHACASRDDGPRKNYGFRFGKSKSAGQDQDRPLCPRDPHHRVWSRARKDAVAQYYCSVCRRAIGGAPVRNRRYYSPEYIQEATALIRDGLSYNSTRAVLAERHAGHRVPSNASLQEWLRHGGNAGNGYATERNSIRARRWTALTTAVDAAIPLLAELLDVGAQMDPGMTERIRLVHQALAAAR